MAGAEHPIDAKLRTAAELIQAGAKKEARQLLRELLAADGNNLAAWELLVKATFNPDEEIYCLKHILEIKPNHPWARERLDALRVFSPPAGITGATKPGKPVRPSEDEPPKKLNGKKAGWILVGVTAAALLCVGTVGLALSKPGILFGVPPAGLTATAAVRQESNCQDLISQAMQASGSYCSRVGADQVCYGNTTIQAQLVPDASQSFSNRGDVVDVSLLRRLSASPLDLEKNQWGVAIFKVLANLPRSLPGEMVTMVVFGNTTLDKNSPGMEAFYFSSGLGKIACQKVYDGILVNMPYGAGIHFTVNGADLTLMGNASLKATKNEDMEVSLFSGSGRIVSNGQEQYFGAGQKVSVQLGGPDGTEAVSPPSSPDPLSPEDMNLVCAMTGQLCNQPGVPTIGADQIQATIQIQLGITPTITFTPSITPIPSHTLTPSRTPTVTRTSTRTSTPSRTNTPTRTSTPTRTFTPTQTRTPTRTSTVNLTWSPTSTFTPSRTPTRSNTPTSSYTPSNTATRTSTVSNTPSFTPSLTSTSSSTNTPTNSATPSDTPTPSLTHTPTDTLPPPTPSDTPTATTAPVCDVTAGPMSSSGKDLVLSLTNNGSTVSVNTVEVIWLGYATGTHLTDISLGITSLWSGNDSSGDYVANGLSGTIAGGGTSATLTATFNNTLASGTQSVTITFDLGCNASQNYTVP